jgi:hypothetical protein
MDNTSMTDSRIDYLNREIALLEARLALARLKKLKLTGSGG